MPEQVHLAATLSLPSSLQGMLEAWYPEFDSKCNIAVQQPQEVTVVTQETSGQRTNKSKTRVRVCM